MSVSVHRLRSAAKADRGEACLRYMRNRSTPITLKQLAAILLVTPRSVQNSLEPLVADGRVVRQKILVERRLAGKQTWAYGYSAAEQKQKPPKRPKFQFHDPFNMTRRTL